MSRGVIVNWPNRDKRSGANFLSGMVNPDPSFSGDAAEKTSLAKKILAVSIVK